MDIPSSFENLKNLEVTPENISDYPEIALGKITTLTEAVVKGDMKELGLSAQDSPDHFIDSDLEDEAFAASSLPDISEVLDDQQAKIDRIQHAGSFLTDKVVELDEIIIPPETTQPHFGDGDTTYEVPGQKSRLQMILFIAQELGTNLEDINVETGIISDGMMRQTSYATVHLPNLDRVVQVCDEEGNATFVFVDSRLIELGITNQDLNASTKSQKNKLLKAHADNPIGARLIYGKNWTERIRESLAADIKPRPEDEDLIVPNNDTHSEAPDCIKDKDNEWHGYWIDEEDGHWSTEGRLAKRLGISPLFTGMYAKTPGQPDPKTVHGLNGHPSAFYKLEDYAQWERVRDLRSNKGLDPDQI